MLTHVFCLHRPLLTRAERQTIYIDRPGQAFEAMAEDVRLRTPVDQEVYFAVADPGKAVDGMFVVVSLSELQAAKQRHDHIKNGIGEPPPPPRPPDAHLHLKVTTAAVRTASCARAHEQARDRALKVASEYVHSAPALST